MASIKSTTIRTQLRNQAKASSQPSPSAEIQELPMPKAPSKQERSRATKKLDLNASVNAGFAQNTNVSSKNGLLGLRTLGAKLPLSLQSFSKILESDPEKAAAQLLEHFPHLRILEDATSYGELGAEVKRSQKSMMTLARFLSGDIEGLAGENADSAGEGVKTLQGIVEAGVLELGEGDALKGFDRMMAILSLHDIGKSNAVAKAAKEKLNVEDHDVVMTRLVSENFQSLEGALPAEQLENLRDAVSDPAVRDHFAKPRGMSGSFNAGRHLQGEAPKALFLANVRGVNASDIAEFIVDWGGVNGHKDLSGPLALAHIAPAINGTASALNKLLTSGAGASDEAALSDLWQEFSYPQNELEDLGLRFDSAKEQATTRLAYMGREHQAEKGTAGVKALRSAIANMGEEFEALESELNTNDLDLGFTPHTVKGLKESLSDLGKSPVFAYEVFARSLGKVLKEVRALSLSRPIISVNFDVKNPGKSAADAAKVLLQESPNLSAKELVSAMNFEISVADDSILVSALR